jgi:hypothetical protein
MDRLNSDYDCTVVRDYVKLFLDEFITPAHKMHVLAM